MKPVILLAAAAVLALAACARNADDAFVGTVNDLRPSVVLLTMDIPGDRKGTKDTEFATGIVVASGTWGSDILTVQHAVDEASNVRVTIGNNVRARGRVVAQNETLDIALVRTGRPNLRVAKLGSAAHAQPGRVIGLLGYPIPDRFDDEGFALATSVSSGRISALREDAIEVTLPIVPGESGAPVFLADTAEIVGIAESRFDEERSIGFALPAQDAARFLHRVDAAHGL